MIDKVDSKGRQNGTTYTPSLSVPTFAISISSLPRSDKTNKKRRLRTACAAVQSNQSLSQRHKPLVPIYPLKRRLRSDITPFAHTSLYSVVVCFHHSMAKNVQKWEI